MSNRLPKSVWIPVLVLSVIIFGWRLNSVPLTNWDEGIYANVNLELFRSHDWSKLTYFGADFLEKPPLQFWMTFVLFGIFGPTELAVRFIPAVAGIATALLLALWAWQATKERGTALLAGMMFTLGQFALVHAFRTGDLDGLLVFCITLALYSYWRSWLAPRWIIIWGIASAAAVMTKSFVGLLPLMIVGLDILISRGWQKIGWGNIFWAIGVFVVLAAPWHIVETIRFGTAFWDSYFGMHVIERTTESLFTVTPWYWYVEIILNRFAPFSFLLPLVLFATCWRWWKEKSGLDRLLLLTTVITFLMFSYIKTRREWYILPIYPGLALLLAITVWQWWRDRQSRRVQIGFILSSVFAFGHLMTDHHLRLALQHFPVLRQLAAPWWRSVAGQMVFGVVVMVSICGVSYLLRGWRATFWRWVMGLSGGILGSVAFGWSLLYIHALPSALPLKTIASRVEQEDVQNISLIGTLLKKQPAGYFYILRMDTHSVEYVPGSPALTPLVLTTNEAKNVPLNTTGKVLSTQPPFLLLDLR